MAKTKTTNFKTYEAQCRLLAAVVASTNCKLDYKAIARYFGSDATEFGLEHRFRSIKKLAKLQEECVNGGKDPMDLPVEGKEIQKLFGESTAAGLEFQFREVKALGKAQRALADSGGDPATVPVGGKTSRAASTASTPRGPRTTSTAGTPRGSGTSTARAPKRPPPIQTPTTKGGDSVNKRRRTTVNLDDSDEDFEGLDFDFLDAPKLKLDKKPSNLNESFNHSSGSGGNSGSLFGNGLPQDGTIIPFGEGQINTANDQATPPSYFGLDAANGGSTIVKDDEIVGINGSQFSNKSQNSQNIFQPKQSAIVKDPFDDDINDGRVDFLNLTAQDDELLDGEI